MNYVEYITTNHPLYDRYYDDWMLQLNSWYGSTEYKNGQYLRAYEADLNTPNESINMYQTLEDGSVVGKQKVSRIVQGQSSEAVNRGGIETEGTFYGEKLNNTPLYNYVKLIVAEYNAILFRNPPQRILPETPETDAFLNDVSGNGESLNEFLSLVDMYTTIFGVCHVGCYKPIGSEVPLFKIHMPTDVTNWEYRYDIDGSLKLTSIVIKLEDSDVHTVYKHITPTKMETVFVGKDEEGYIPPVDADQIEDLGDGTYRVVQENELGYIPVKTIYQSTKVYNNVGTTIIGDVAHIQRSIYGDMAEIYQAITYGAHPTLIIDTETDTLNDGQIQAEPGGIVKVQGSLTGEKNYTYEFVTPPLDAISEIRELVDSKINKLTQISMIRSEDIIRSSTSGEQIEVYDDKLSSLIRRKATNLENAEQGLWKMWADWMNIQLPDDFAVSYNRHYNKRALQHEVAELDSLITMYERYRSVFGDNGEVEVEEYSTAEEAEQRARDLGGSGFHQHTEDGVTVYMPFATHAEYEAAIGVGISEEDNYKEDLRDRMRQRIEELFNSSSTHNSL